jgi:hypothetical protein
MAISLRTLADFLMVCRSGRLFMLDVILMVWLTALLRKHYPCVRHNIFLRKLVPPCIYGIIFVKRCEFVIYLKCSILIKIIIIIIIMII